MTWSQLLLRFLHHVYIVCYIVHARQSRYKANTEYYIPYTICYSHRSLLLVPIVVNHCARLYSHFLSSLRSLYLSLRLCVYCDLLFFGCFISRNHNKVGQIQKRKRERVERGGEKKVKNKIIIFFVGLFFWGGFFLYYDRRELLSCCSSQHSVVF